MLAMAKLTFSVFLFLVKHFQQTESMCNKFAEVVERQQDDCNASVGEEVEESNDDTTSNRVLNLCGLLVFLDLLEVQLRQHVQVIRQLDDEVQFVEEAHWVVGIIRP